MEKTLIYLATPYSHPDPAVRELRFHQVNRVAARLMHKGLHIFSPISHTHPIAVAGELPTGFDYWEKYDRAILSTCCKVIVLRLEDWIMSVGVAKEIQMARQMGIPVEFIDPDDADCPDQDPPPDNICRHCGAPYDGGHRCGTCRNGDPLNTGEFDPETGAERQ